jgi:anthranilate phosphoribosyltransferase
MMSQYRETLALLVAGQDLPPPRVVEIFQGMEAGAFSDTQIAALLAAWAAKGETPDEIMSAVTAMAARWSAARLACGTLADTCGTGGDGLKTFNISTAAAFVIAACGVAVGKHGTRAGGSSSGSADLLDAIGIDIDAPAPRVLRCIETVGIGFVYAPHWNPVQHVVMKVRQQTGLRTIFNFLGPLTNPLPLTHRLLGVSRADLLLPFAEAMRRRGLRRSLIVHGEDGMDEVTLAGKTRVVEQDGDTLRAYDITPEQFGMVRATHADLRGEGSNAALVQRILSGKEIGPRTDAVALNAAFALYAAMRVDTLLQGLRMAQAALRDGSPWLRAVQLRQELPKIATTGRRRRRDQTPGPRKATARRASPEVTR